MIGADSGDSEIVSATVRLGDGRLKCVVMDREFHSEPLAEKPNAGTLIAWCDAVRTFAQQVVEEAARDRRVERRGLEEAPGAGDSGSEKADDPTEWVRRNFRTAGADLESARAVLCEAESTYEKWAALAAALEIGEDEDVELEERSVDGSDSDDSDSSGGDPESGTEPVQPVSVPAS